ncbi:MAG: hypothetical protein V5A64_05945, partial [Candidatus Thermoplasmatota archaeon]
MGFNKKILSSIVVALLIFAFFVNISGDVFPNMVLFGGADWNSSSNNDTSWHNSSYLNVTIEAKWPRILWYDIQKCTAAKTEDDTTAPAFSENWTSVRNNISETDNATWYRFVINVSSDQGW